MGWLNWGFAAGRRTSNNQTKAPKRCFGHSEGVGGFLLTAVRNQIGGGVLNSSLQTAERIKINQES